MDNIKEDSQTKKEENKPQPEQQIKKRRIGRPPLIRTDKTVFKKVKKDVILHFD